MSHLLKRSFKIKPPATLSCGGRDWSDWMVKWNVDSLKNPAFINAVFDAESFSDTGSVFFRINLNVFVSVTHHVVEQSLMSVSIADLTWEPWIAINEEEAMEILLQRSPTYHITKAALDGGGLSRLTELINTSINPEAVIREAILNAPIRRVVCAANLVHHETFPDGYLIIPANRHHSPLMNRLYDALGCGRGGDIALDLYKTEQGFIDQWGEFMSRTEAYQLVQLNGQPFDPKRNGCNRELFSEGLY